MEDHYFEKKFKEILENPPEFQAPEEAVEDMRRRIREDQRKPFYYAWLKFWPFLLLLAFLLASGFAYRAIDQLKEELATLKLEQGSSTLTIIDTIYQKHTVYQIDTIYQSIYQKIYREELIYPPAQFSLYREPTTGGILSSRIRESFTNQPFPFLFTNLNDELLGSLRNPSVTDTSFFQTPAAQNIPEESKESAPFNWKNIVPIPGISNELSAKEHGLSVLQAPLLLPSKRQSNLFYQFVPTGLRGSMSISPIINPSHSYGGSALAFGPHLEVEFPNYRSLQIGAEWLRMKFELKEEAQFADFPLVAGEDPTDVLHELKPEFTYLQIPIVLRQKLLYRNAVQLNLGGGIVAYKPLQQRYAYEFIGNGREYKISQDFRNGAFSVNSIRLVLGAEYELGRLSFSSEFQYQHGFSLNEHEIFPLRFWGINLASNYRF